MDEKQLQVLWESFAKNSGGFNDYNEYKSLMGNANARKVFFDSYKTDIGFEDYTEFESLLGVGKPTEVSAQGLAGTSGTSGEPMQSTQTQEGLPLQPNASSSTQSLTGNEFVNRANALNQTLQQATGLQDPNNTFEIELAEGEEFLPNRLTEEGLPIIANIEEGTASNILSPVDLQPTRDEALAQNQRIENQDKGIMSDLYNSLQQGLTDFNAGISAIPEYLYEIGAVPQNLLADAIENNAGEGTADWLRARYENVENGVYNPLRILSDYSKSQKEQSEEYAQAVTQFDEDILGSLTNGNFGDAGRQVINSIVASTPAIVGMSATAGAGSAAGLGNIGRTALNALPFAAGAYQDIESKEDMPQGMKIIASGLKGLSEVIFEQEFGTLSLIKSIANKSMGREGVKDFAEGYMAKLLSNNGIPASAFKGSISEGSTTLAQNIIEKYSGENPDKDLWEGVADAMIVGGVMDAGISGGGKISSAIMSPETHDRVAELESQSVDLRNDLNTATNPEIIQQALEVNTEEINSLINQDELENASLPPEIKSEVTDINNRIGDIDATLASEELSDGSKSALESQSSSLKEQRKDLVENNKLPEQKVSFSEAISEPAVYYRDGEVGSFSQDEGGKITFETESRIYDIGQIEDVGSTDISSMNIEVERPIEVSIEGNRISVEGQDFVNNFSEPDAAINRDGDGRVISINLETPDGKKRTIRGQRADAIVYEYQNRRNENTEIPSDPIVEVADTPTETAVEQTQELVTEIPAQNETITETETVVPEAGQPDQNVVTETVEIEPTVDQNVQDEQTPVQEEIMSPEVVNEAETQTIPNEVQTENTIEENEPAPVPTETVQESTPTTKAKPKTAKGVLKGVSDRVAATGLARSVKLADSATISAELGVQGDNVNGYVNAEGDIVINQDKAGIDTPIHEVSHVWEQTVARDNPELHTRGMSLIQTEEGNPYVDFVRQTQPGLEGDALYKEALAQAIGDRGAKLIKSQKRGKIKEWLDAAWEYIGNLVGISGLTPDQIANLTLNQFADAAAVDLLSGKEFASLPNGDSVMKSDAEKASDLSASEKKIADFMERMRNKNNIKYQGTVPAGQLTPDEMKDFIDVVTELQKTGQVGNFSDLKEFASSVGITDIGQIRLAWNANNTPVGIKKGLLDAKTILDTDIEKMSREEWIALGKRMVDEGLVDADALVKDLVQYPRALQPYEVTALIYKKSLVEKEIDQLSTKTDVDSMALLDARLQMIKDFELITLNTAYQQGIALNLRAVMTDRDFNVVEILSDMRKQGDVSEEVRKRLESLGKELEIVKSDLRKRTAELESQKEKWEQEAINKTSGKPAVNVRENISRARKDALEVLDSINIADFGMAGMNFQMNGGIRFSIQPNNALIQAIESSLQFMRDNVSNGTLTLAEAVESAVDQVNQSVGKGKWDEMKFRSSILNSYVDKGHAPLAKKPYVATDGSLVVPTQYLKDIVKAYRANNSGEMSIEQIVDAVSAEVGNGFDTREIRNAVTGYGRAVQNTITDDQRNINTARSIGKLLSELEDLEKLGPNPKSRNQRKMNERIVDLRKMIADLEDSMTSTPEEKAQMKQDKAAQAKKEYLKGYIDKIKKKIADGDFEPQTKVPKYDFSNDPEIIDLEKKREDIRNQFKAAKYEHELKNRTLKGKVFYWGEQVFFGLSRGVQAGADISSFLIQGGLVTFADPQRSIKALKTSVSKAGNSDAYHDYFHELQRDPFFEVARKAKLNMQLPNFYQNIVEEQLGGGNVLTWLWESGVDTVIKDKDLAKKFKDRFPFTAAERQYAMFLSDIRFNLFKTAATDAMNYLGVNADTKEGQAKLSEIAEAVNDITMASNIKSLEGATKVQKAVNLLFFSARKIAANFKILYKLPMYTSYYLANRGSRAFGRNDIANRTEFEAMIFQRLYGRYAGAGLGLMAASVLIPTLIANAAYDEDEEEIPLLYNPYILNPIHSDFMKLKIGDTRWSPFLGIEGAVGLIARLSTQSYMTSTSDQVREMGKRQGIQTNKTGFDIFSQFMRNKLAPTPAIISGIYGTEFEQRETSDRISKSFYPMWISGAMEEYETSNNLTRTLGTTALGLFGANFNTYGGAQFASAEGTNNKQAYNIMRKAGIADYTPDFRNKPMIEEGSLVDELSKAKMKKEYGPKYNEYMTAGVLAKKAIIQDPVTTLAAKESQVDNLKKEAYRYAELKTTGVIVDANFRQFTHEGVKYSLTKKQYKEKIKLVEQYMKEFVDSGYRADVRDLVIEKLDKDGIGRNPEYIKMRTDIQIWNEANSWANEELSYNFTPGKYIPTTQYDERSDDYTED